MNMLRTWGRWYHEHDVFYELCNRSGILVWQDFMFACAMYPENNPTFVYEVEAEAIYQERRLRNHPCMALWCGNGEKPHVDQSPEGVSFLHYAEDMGRYE